MEQPIDRRAFLSAAGATLFAGCSGQSGADGTGVSTTLPTDTASGTTTGRSVETPTGTETRTAEPLDIGVVYVPFAGGKIGRCTSAAAPEVGRYGDPIPSTTVDRHVRQLSNAGVSSVMFNFGESEADYARYESYDGVESTRELGIEPYYVVGQAMRRERDVERDLTYLRDQFLPRDHARRVDDRPVVTLWDVHYLGWAGDEASRAVKRRIDEEWGGLREFVRFVRDALTLDGTEPVLIGDVHDNVLDGGFSSNYEALNAELDGVTTWTGLLRPGETVPWKEARDHVERNFAALAEYAAANDLRFEPTAFPGFDDRANECWGDDRYVPRDPSHLRDLLELAAKYATHGRATVATFNGWAEGHQIEPGRFGDEDYETSYLDVVAEFTA